MKPPEYPQLRFIKNGLIEFRIIFMVSLVFYRLEYMDDIEQMANVLMTILSVHKWNRVNKHVILYPT